MGGGGGSDAELPQAGFPLIGGSIQTGDFSALPNAEAPRAVPARECDK